MTVPQAKQEKVPTQQSQKQNRQRKNPSKLDKEVGQIKITFYTDPLCCWSWAFEPQWKKLLDNHGNEIQYEYVMGGLIPNWQTYNDPLNSVSKPIQMGPVWMHASEVTRVKMKYSIWHEDPPSSSYPACIAVKTVGLQSAAAAEAYLNKIRRAVMEEGQNISKPGVLLSIASELAMENFDFNKFETDWQLGKGNDSFRDDLKKTKFHGIGRFPTLTLQNATGKGIMLVGYRPYESLNQALSHIQNLKP
jgi:putative protein-disulfide isomerase